MFYTKFFKLLRIITYSTVIIEVMICAHPLPRLSNNIFRKFVYKCGFRCDVYGNQKSKNKNNSFALITERSTEFILFYFRICSFAQTNIESSNEINIPQKLIHLNI